MGKVYEAIDAALAEFIQQQHLFFVASAPLSAEGHINVSPKGCDSFAVIDPQTVAYIDLTGSGIETVAHVRDNGRIVLMFCAFDGPPKIVRLYGLGEVIEPGDGEFEQLRSRFPAYNNARAIIVVRLTRVSDSCGYSIPLYDYRGERDQLFRWADHKGEDGLRQYQAEKNTRSIDGLAGLRRR